MSLSGLWKFVWFRMLKNSARNWMSFDSPTGMFLNNEKSQSVYPGPCAMLRPAVPNCCTGELGSWVIRWNAFGLSQALVVVGPSLGLATTFGRLEKNPLISGAEPCTEKSLPSKTVNGVPDIAVTIPFTCQLPRIC